MAEGQDRPLPDGQSRWAELGVERLKKGRVEVHQKAAEPGKELAMSEKSHFFFICGLGLRWTKTRKAINWLFERTVWLNQNMKYGALLSRNHLTLREGRREYRGLPVERQRRTPELLLRTDGQRWSCTLQKNHNRYWSNYYQFETYQLASCPPSKCVHQWSNSSLSSYRWQPVTVLWVGVRWWRSWERWMRCPSVAPCPQPCCCKEYQRLSPLDTLWLWKPEGPNCKKK